MEIERVTPGAELLAACGAAQAPDQGRQDCWRLAPAEMLEQLEGPTDEVQRVPAVDELGAGGRAKRHSATVRLGHAAVDPRAGRPLRRIFVAYLYRLTEPRTEARRRNAPCGERREPEPRRTTGAVLVHA